MARESYTATYQIGGGVKRGAGTWSDYYEESREVRAKTPEDAFLVAMVAARKLAWDHIPNPHTGETKVTLLSLLGPDGKPVPFDKDTAVVSRRSLGSLLVTPASPPPAATG